MAGIDLFSVHTPDNTVSHVKSQSNISAFDSVQHIPWNSTRSVHNDIQRAALFRFLHCLLYLCPTVLSLAIPEKRSFAVLLIIYNRNLFPFHYVTTDNTLSVSASGFFGSWLSIRYPVAWNVFPIAILFTSLSNITSPRHTIVPMVLIVALPCTCPSMAVNRFYRLT